MKSLTIVLSVVLAMAASASASYIDDFSTDTLANYTQGTFEQVGGVVVPTIAGGQLVLTGQSIDSGSQYMMLTQGETLDVGEYAEVTVTLAAGGLHWRNVGMILSNETNPAINGGGPWYGNGFYLAIAPGTDNSARGAGLEGFAGFANGGTICDMGILPTPYASTAISGSDTHVLRIAKNADSFVFSVDGAVLYTYGAGDAGLQYVGLHVGDWANNAVASFDNFQIVPEPATMALLGLGGLAALLRRRKA